MDTVSYNYNHKKRIEDGVKIVSRTPFQSWCTGKYFTRIWGLPLSGKRSLYILPISPKHVIFIFINFALKLEFGWQIIGAADAVPGKSSDFLKNIHWCLGGAKQVKNSRDGRCVTRMFRGPILVDRMMGS